MGNSHVNSPQINATRAGTPIPRPTFAPVLRPPESESVSSEGAVVGDGVGVAIASVEVIEDAEVVEEALLDGNVEAIEDVVDDEGLVEEVLEKKASVVGARSL